jgi:hypothetical protein
MNKQFIKYNIILTILLLIIFYPLAYFLYHSGYFLYDYQVHLSMVEKMISCGSIFSIDIPSAFLSHPFYHIVVIFFVKLFNTSVNDAGYVLVPFSFQLLSGLTIFWYLDRFSNEKCNRLILVFISLSLLIVTPISVFTFSKLYTGYIGINTYHSPTQILLKSSSIIFMVLIFYGLFKVENSLKYYLALTLATFSSLFIKPSFMICFIPGVLVFSAFSILRKNFINLYVVFCVFIVSVIILSVQFWLTYSSGNNGLANEASRIMFLPFVVVLKFSRPVMIFPYFVLSVLFPLSTYLLFYDDARKDRIMNLSWVVFLVSIFYYYFLGESGSRLYDANFFWGAQISLLLVFIFSVRMLINHYDKLMARSKKYLYVCGFIYFSHFITGILYAVKLMLGYGYH